MSDQHHESTLTKRVAVGATWLVAGRWIIRLIGLISVLFLARLLTPEDFGIVALAGLVVAVLDALTDFRFGQALVHYQDATNEEYNTAWTFNVIRGTVVAVVLVGGASLFADIFKDPRLVPVFQVLAVVAVLDGLQNIGTIQFTKDIRFDRDFRLKLIPRLCTFVITVALAFLWRSYWALIAGMVAGRFASLIMSYAMHPYRPRLCISAPRRLFAFSSWLMGGQVISLINQRLEQLLIGGFLSPALVGIYNVAYELAAMATTELVGPAASALFPGFSQIANDKARLRQAYEKSVQFVVAIGTPLGIGLALVAPEFVVIVLGLKWTDAVPPLRVLSIMFSVSVLALASTGLLPAMGRTRDVFMIDFILFVVRIPATALVVWRFGFAAAAWARLVAGIWWVIHYTWVVRQRLDIAFGRVFFVTWRSYAAAATMTVVVLIVDAALHLPTAAQVLKDPLTTVWVTLIVKVVAGAAAYVLSHLLFWQLQGRPDGPERIIILAAKPRLRFLN